MINEQYGTENITDIQRIRLGYARKEKVCVMFCLTVDVWVTAHTFIQSFYETFSVSFVVA